MEEEGNRRHDRSTMGADTRTRYERNIVKSTETKILAQLKSSGGSGLEKRVASLEARLGSIEDKLDAALGRLV